MCCRTISLQKKKRHLLICMKPEIQFWISKSNCKVILIDVVLTKISPEINEDVPVRATQNLGVNVFKNILTEKEKRGNHEYKNRTCSPRVPSSSRLQASYYLNFDKKDSSNNILSHLPNMRQSIRLPHAEFCFHN